MQHLIVELIPDPDLGGYTARLPDVPAYGEGETQDEAIADLQEAIRGYIETFGLDSLSCELVAELLERGLRQWRTDRALDRYLVGDISFAAAAECAGVSRSELARQAHVRGVEPPVSAETLAEELA